MFAVLPRATGTGQVVLSRLYRCMKSAHFFTPCQSRNGQYKVSGCYSVVQFYHLPELHNVNHCHADSENRRHFSTFLKCPIQMSDGSKAKHSTDSKNYNESKWLTVPNLLTGFRMLISPYIGYLVLQQDFTSAFGLFVLAGATDSIDGWIARNVKEQSSILGSYIDPLADKALVSILTFTLTWVNIIPVPLCFVIIARDLMIMSTAGHFHYKHLKPPKTMARFFDFENSKVQMEPTQISKYNTFLQLGLVALSIGAPVFHFVNHPYLCAYWYLVASTTVLSGLSYVVKDKSNYFVK